MSGIFTVSIRSVIVLRVSLFHYDFHRGRHGYLYLKRCQQPREMGQPSDNGHINARPHHGRGGRRDYRQQAPEVQSPLLGIYFR